MAALADTPELRGRILAELGFPDNLLPQIISDKLVEFSRLFHGTPNGTNEKTRNLTTVANQQAYSLDADILDVLEVFWPGLTVPSPDPLSYPTSYPGFPSEPMSRPMDLSDRSLSMAVEMEIHQARDRRTGGGDHFLRDGAVYLLPPPTTSGQTVPMIVLVDSGIAGIDERHRDMLVYRVAADCSSVLAAAELKEVIVDTSAENRPGRLASDVWYKHEDRLRKKFQELWDRYLTGRR